MIPKSPLYFEVLISGYLYTPPVTPSQMAPLTVSLLPVMDSRGILAGKLMGEKAPRTQSS